MKTIKLVLTAFIILSVGLETQAQLWVPSTDSTTCGKLSAVTTAYFDTIATWVEGKIINGETKRPISNAIIKVAYYECHSTTLKTREVVADGNGLFKLGWVGCASARLLAVEAPGFCTMRTGRVDMGGLSKVTAELMPLAATEERRQTPKRKK